MSDRRAGRVYRRAAKALWLAVGSIGAAAPAGPAFAAVSYEARGASESLESFYSARADKPLWFDSRGTAGMGQRNLIALLRSAAADGLNPQSYHSKTLDRVLRSARSGRAADVLRADRMLSQAFLAFVRDQRRTPRIDMVWVDPELLPAAPSPRALLEEASRAPSLEFYLAEMRWMSPIYAGLRRAIANGFGSTESEQALLRVNLERARALPSGAGRYVLVNAAAARLTAYEGREIVDSMRVVVGKPVYPTPMMAALIRFTSLNPYWNVPPDLAAENIAPKVVKGGKAYLKAKGYQLLSSWDEDARVVDPATVDWKKVAARKTEVRLRQLPGPANSMGQMKFMFPNIQGIYLHDTPHKELLSEASRMFSGGCVRLEDAARLARWLHGEMPTTASKRPEQRVDLPQPVPVFITYLTAFPSGSKIAYFADFYGRDQKALASLGRITSLAGR